MSFYFPNVDPTYVYRRKGTTEDPFIFLNESSKKVVNNKIVLREIPDFNKIIIVKNSSGATLTRVTSDTLKTNEYRVDFSVGLVFFHSGMEGQIVSIEYTGTGYVSFPASRIWIEATGEQVQKTLQDLIAANEYQSQYAKEQGDYAKEQATKVNVDVSNYEVLKQNAILAIDGANVAASTALSASTNANNKATLAQSKADLADQKATLAQTAIGNITTKISEVDTAITNSNTATSNTISLMNNFVHKGNYNASTSYLPRNVVAYNGSSYMNTVASTNILPTDTSKWQLIATQGIQGVPGVQGIQGIQGNTGASGAKGDQGIQGVKGDTGTKGDKGDTGLKGDKGDTGSQGIQGAQGIKGEKGDAGDITNQWKREYVTANAYLKGNIVGYNGSTYVAKQTTTGNLPTDDTYWDIFTQKGQDGAGSVLSVNGKSGDVTLSASDVGAETTAGSQSKVDFHASNTNLHVTVAEKENWNAKSNFNGDYTELTNKPNIPPLNNTVISNSTTESATANSVKIVNDSLTTHKSDYISHTGYVNTTGTANTYIATLSPALSSYKEGVSFRMKIHINNTGASTVNVNGLGAKPITKANGTDIGSGGLKVGSVYTVVYNGTSFILQADGGDLALIATAIRSKGGSVNNTDSEEAMASAINAIVLGKNFKIGTAVSGTNIYDYRYADNSGTAMFYSLNVSGLSFKPTVIIAVTGGSYGYVVLYNELYDSFTNKTVKIFPFNGNYNSTINQNIKGDISPVVVTNGSFSLPTSAGGLSYTYIAIE